MQPLRQNVNIWFNQTALTSLFRRLNFTITHTYHNSRFVLHTTGKLRRFFLVHFRKGHIQRELQLREGGCNQCGTCCNLLFTCPMLTRQGRCLTYGSYRPKACKVFPIDQRDIDDVKLCGSQCGYRFNRTYPGGRTD